MEKKRTMKKRWVLDQAARHAIEETWAVFTNGAITPNPALFLARLADLARSNAFLWTEAGLSVQEHATRVVPVGQSLSRSLVLATVAADIFVGYTSLRERAKWLPSLVKPRDWELQHQRSANRVLETSASLGGALIKACQFASTRPDLLPAVYIRTLAPLQDRMPARPWSEIEKAITRELGRRPADVFAQIEREPGAAASIAQVQHLISIEVIEQLGNLVWGNARLLQGLAVGNLDAVDELHDEQALGAQFGNAHWNEHI